MAFRFTKLTTAVFPLSRKCVSTLHPVCYSAHPATSSTLPPEKFVTNLGVSGFPLSDSATNQIFYLQQISGQPRHPYRSHPSIAPPTNPSIPLPFKTSSANPLHFVRWGANGLAFTTVKRQSHLHCPYDLGSRQPLRPLRRHRQTNRRHRLEIASPRSLPFFPGTANLPIGGGGCKILPDPQCD